MLNIKYNKQNDGYIFARVSNENDYLNYMYSPMNGWCATVGKVDDKEFKGSKNLKYLWERKGRGRAAETTWNKLCDYTRKEADYYKKKHNKAKVITDYEVCDLNTGIFTDNYKCKAESPAKAIEQYIKENNLNIKVEVDLFNKGRFVVTSNKTSKVYREV